MALVVFEVIVIILIVTGVGLALFWNPRWGNCLGQWHLPMSPALDFLTWLPRAYSAVFRHANPIPFEMMFAGVSFVWGTWLMFPWWETFGTSPGFRVMHQLADEGIWGVSLVIVAVGHYLSLYHQDLLWRYRWSMASYLVWAFISFNFMYANFKATSTPIYGTITLGLLILTVRLRREWQWKTQPPSSSRS